MPREPVELLFKKGNWWGQIVHYRVRHLIIKVESPDESEQAVAAVVKDILEHMVSHFWLRAVIGRWTYVEIADDTDIPALANKIYDNGRDPRVEYAEPDLAMRLAARPSDRLLDPPGINANNTDHSQWAIDHLRMPEAWDIVYPENQTSLAADNVVIGLLDSGVPIRIGIDTAVELLNPGDPIVNPADPTEDWMNHEDLTGTRFLAGNNYTYWPPIPYPADTRGHGANMAGIIAATPDNPPADGEPGVGIAGMNWHSPVYVCRVTTDSGGLVMERITTRRVTIDGETTETVTREILVGDQVIPAGTVITTGPAGETIVEENTVVEEVSTEALVYQAVHEVLAYAQNAKRTAVINLSLTFLDYIDGADIEEGTLIDQSRTLTDEGAILVCAAGNNNGPVQYPAAAALLYEGSIIAVGATDADDTRHFSSNYGPEVSVGAPGDVIMSTGIYSGDHYEAQSGTSYATAHVTGLVSLMWNHNRNMTAAQIISCLKRSSRIPHAIWTASDDHDTLKKYYGEGLISPVCALEAVEWEVVLDTPDVAFEDVPATEQPNDAIQLSVRSCATLYFTIEGGEDFGLPGFYLHTPPTCVKDWSENETSTDCLTCDFSTIVLPVTYSRALPDHAEAVVTITWIQHEGLTAEELAAQSLVNPQFVVRITANRVGARRSAVMLVLDKSGSMKRAAGPEGLTRMTVVKYSSSILIDLVNELSAVGILSFNHKAHNVSNIKLIPQVAEGATNPTREALKSAIGGISAGGSTSIGAGVQKAGKKLGGLPANFVEGDEARAVIVVTDGVNNHVPSLSDIIAAGFAYPVYAIGIGSPESIQSQDLIALAEMTGGYVAITGPLSPENIFLIAKFYHEMLTEIDADSLPLDPVQRLLPGVHQDFKIDVTRDDARLDITVMRPADAPIKVDLFAPGKRDNPVDSTVVISQHGTLVSRYRVGLPEGSREDSFRTGSWTARVSMQHDDFDNFLDAMRGSRAEIRETRIHGVRFALQAVIRSTLRMHARVHQNSFAPGSILHVNVTMTHGGLPLSRSVVLVTVTRPDGRSKRIRARHRHDGLYEATYVATAPGVYMCQVVARGRSPSGGKYRREKLLTGVVLAPRGVNR